MVTYCMGTKSLNEGRGRNQQPKQASRLSGSAHTWRCFANEVRRFGTSQAGARERLTYQDVIAAVGIDSKIVVEVYGVKPSLADRRKSKRSYRSQLQGCRLENELRADASSIGRG